MNETKDKAVVGYAVYDSNMLGKIVATFKTKRELFKYNETHNLNADQIALFNKQHPDGYVFMGWDEIGD